MPSQYPDAFDTFPSRSDGQPIYAAHVQNLQDSVAAIQSTLGLHPEGTSSTVSERLSSGFEFTATADEPLSSPRVVTFSESGFVRYMDASDPADTGVLPLVTVQSASMAGQEVRVVSQGPVAWSSSGLIRGATLFLGRHGTIMSAQPAGMVFSLIVAYALDTDTIFVDPQQPILM